LLAALLFGGSIDSELTCSRASNKSPASTDSWSCLLQQLGDMLTPVLLDNATGQGASMSSA
jgi:hypothetical protein